MRQHAYPDGPHYRGRLSSGGWVGPTVTVRPETRTMIVDGGLTWHVRVGREDGPDGHRYVPVTVRHRQMARFRPANPLREQD